MWTVLVKMRIRILEPHLPFSGSGSRGQNVVWKKNYSYKRKNEQFAKKNEWFVHSLFCAERPEGIAHGCSFVMRHLTDWLTVTHLSWVTWANCSHLHNAHLSWVIWAMYLLKRNQHMTECTYVRVCTCTVPVLRNCPVWAWGTAGGFISKRISLDKYTLLYL